MPTYDLTCAECGERFERFLMRLLRDEDKVCPHCGSRNVGAGVGGGVLAVGASRGSSAASCNAGSGFR